jgi:hypothetical protein
MQVIRMHNKIQISFFFVSEKASWNGSSSDWTTDAQVTTGVFVWHSKYQYLITHSSYCRSKVLTESRQYSDLTTKQVVKMRKISNKEQVYFNNLSVHYPLWLEGCQKCHLHKPSCSHFLIICRNVQFWRYEYICIMTLELFYCVFRCEHIGLRSSTAYPSSTRE